MKEVRGKMRLTGVVEQPSGTQNEYTGIDCADCGREVHDIYLVGTLGTRVFRERRCMGCGKQVVSRNAE